MSALWFACSEPERPTDPYVQWHYRDGDDECRGCQLKLAMVERTFPSLTGDRTFEWLRDGVGTFA